MAEVVGMGISTPPIATKAALQTLNVFIWRSCLSSGPVSRGFLQGSVLEPLLFSLYSSSLTISSLGIQYCLYADLFEYCPHYCKNLKYV